MLDTETRENSKISVYNLPFGEKKLGEKVNTILNNQGTKT